MCGENGTSKPETSSLTSAGGCPPSLLLLPHPRPPHFLPSPQSLGSVTRPLLQAVAVETPPSLCVS